MRSSDMAGMISEATVILVTSARRQVYKKVQIYLHIPSVATAHHMFERSDVSHRAPRHNIRGGGARADDAHQCKAPDPKTRSWRASAWWITAVARGERSCALSCNLNSVEIAGALAKDQYSMPAFAICHCPLRAAKLGHAIEDGPVDCRSKPREAAPGETSHAGAEV
jgi:hypothetical protein